MGRGILANSVRTAGATGAVRNRTRDVFGQIVDPGGHGWRLYRPPSAGPLYFDSTAMIPAAMSACAPTPSNPGPTDESPSSSRAKNAIR